MLYSISVPVEAVNEDEFLDLVHRLAKVYGQTVEIQKQITIWTGNEDLKSVLESLADATRNGGPTVDVAPRNGHKKQKKLGGGKRGRKPKPTEDKGKREPTRGPHIRSIKIEGTGEMISRFELDKRLKERTIDPGTQLHSPKHGTITVRNNVPAGAPYTLINLVGEVISKGGDAVSN